MLLLENEVTVADLTLALEEREVKELSDLDDPCGTTINATKLQYALDRAHEEVNSYFVVTGNCGKALIKLNAKNIIIATARYLLDTFKSRPNVVADYERALERLQQYSTWDDERNCPLSDSDLEEILGEPAPLVDKNFRFNSGTRRWLQDDFKLHQKRLFDNRVIGGQRRINRTHWTDDIDGNH